MAVTASGEGDVLFRIEDIYTGTIDDNGQVIQGVEGAHIRLSGTNELADVERSAKTGPGGELLLEDLPAGFYRYRISKANHEQTAGRLEVEPGITRSRKVFLDYQTVSVDWSVTETTIQDEYDITLEATYETDVPAAVLKVTPKAVELPDMAPGDVFYGEIRITNVGLVRADELRLSFPTSDEHFRYEPMGDLPDTLAAKASTVVPYRVVMKSPLAPTGAASGGGCYTYEKKAKAECQYDCANGDTRSASDTTHWYKSSTGDCGSSGGSGGGGGNFDFTGGGAGGQAGTLPSGGAPPQKNPPIACPGGCEGDCGGGGGSGGDGGGGG